MKTCVLAAVLSAALLGHASPQSVPLAPEPSPAQEAAVAPSAADELLQRGVAQARAGDWEAAERALLDGHARFPEDHRFAAELAGVAFRRGRREEARRWLRRALTLEPEDEYAHQFLATLYFLDDNLEAALKFGNRAGWPRIAALRTAPAEQPHPVLVDHALAVSPATVLRGEDLLLSQARLEQLNIFSRVHFALTPGAGEEFDLVLRTQQPVTWRQNALLAAARMMRGIPWAVQPDAYGIGESSITVTSLLRWDPRKQRLHVRATRPLHRDPAWQFGLSFDGRDEEWSLRNLEGWTPQTPLLLHRSAAAGLFLSQVLNARCRWGMALAATHRSYAAGPALPPELIAGGPGFKHGATLGCDLLRLPEHRLLLQGELGAAHGRVWAATAERYATLDPRLRLEWFPQARGNDYRLLLEVRGGAGFGRLPLDEHYTLAMDRDEGVPLRGQRAHRGRRKGAAPLARSFFLTNAEMDKNIFDRGLVALSVGPFVDVAQARAAFPELDQQTWFLDGGVQAKVRVLRDFGVSFSYGRNLRRRGDAFTIYPLR